MRIGLALVVLLLTVQTFSQQSAKANPAVLLHGDHPPAVGEATGAIQGFVISPQGQPVKGVLVTVHWVCPESCFGAMSSTVTDDAGVYRFEPVSFGKYAVFVGLPFDFGDIPSIGCATPLTDYTVELSADHPEAEVRFELCERVPPEKHK
jgi:Carboxypeptidase regulatory-like domain